MEAPPEKQAVRVTILSRPYVLRTTGDPREVEEVARRVDELMLAIASRSPNADSTHIAVLACMHLADKLRALERDLTQLRDRVDRKSGEFAGMLEQLIASAEEK
ncbi:MAG TPA: cell division protein ZapA [Candidatus Sulfopaludibacter sp.]|nr:cell division protein ZapA [Candidatus Sulfopaludibacter sp.]